MALPRLAAWRMRGVISIDLHVSNKSQIAAQALRYISQLYDVEREVKHIYADGSAIAKALDYSLKRWFALTRFLGDGQLPIDNNWIENQIRPIAIGSFWTFPHLRLGNHPIQQALKPCRLAILGKTRILASWSHPQHF